MKIIIPTNSEEPILVDDIDYEYLSEFNWMVNHYGYAVRYDKEKNGILMHREILKPKDKQEVDHMNHNHLDNRRCNIRICTSKENSANTRKHRDNQCKYKGVSKLNSGNFQMRVTSGDTKISFVFSNEDSAGSAYNYFAKQILGDYAYMNDINIPREEWEKDIVVVGTDNKRFTSSYRGVCLVNSGKWRAEIRDKDRKKISLGTYENENDAGIAYNLKAIELYGEDAKLNHVDDDYYFFTIMQRALPKSNMYKTRVVNGRAIIYTTRELEDFELMVGKVAENAIPRTINTYASMYVRVYQQGKRWLDIDNTFKALQDSLDNTKKIKKGKREIQVCSTGISNDRYFQLIIGERIHVETKEEERLEVLIEDYKGLFHFVDTIKEHYGIDENYYEDLFLPEI